MRNTRAIQRQSTLSFKCTEEKKDKGDASSSMLLSEKIVQGASDLVLTTVWCQNNKLEGKTFIFDAHWKKRCTKWGIGTFLHCCTISKAKKIQEHQVSYNSVAIVEKMS